MSQVILDLEDPTPPYEQLRRGIVEQIRAGALRAGDRLPSVRALARDLGIAPGTVGRAYKELEEAGVLVTARGAGTRVADGVVDVAAAARSASAGGRTAPLVAPETVEIPPDLQGLIDDAVDAARGDGHEDAAILAAVRRALQSGSVERTR